jgi:multiple sugar transport system substrate-binding protein
MKSERRIVRFVSFVVVALVLTSAVFAAGQAEAESDGTYLRLGWWGNPTRDANTEGAAAMYMEQNPEVEIELETVGWGGYWDRINTQAAAGSLPDVMQHDYSQIYEWVQRGLLTDLTPYIESGAIDTSNIAGSFLDGGRFDGGVYGISLGTNALTAVYDPAILAEAGIDEIDSTEWTWADFEEIAIQVYEETGVQTMPIVSGDPRHGLENFLIQIGQTVFGEDGESLGFTDTEVLREFFEVQLRIQEAGALIAPEVAFVRVTPEEDELANGNSWIDWIWSNQLVSVQAANENPLTPALLPQVENAEQPGTYLKPSMFFSVTAHSENPDQAVDFVDFFVNDVEVNTEILTAERGVPIPADVRSALAEQVDETNRKVFDFIALAGDNSSPIPLPDPDGSAEVVDLINRTTQEVLLGGISVDEAVERILTEGNQILTR